MKANVSRNSTSCCSVNSNVRTRCRTATPASTATTTGGILKIGSRFTHEVPVGPLSYAASPPSRKPDRRIQEKREGSRPPLSHAAGLLPPWRLVTCPRLPGLVTVSTRKQILPLRSRADQGPQAAVLANPPLVLTLTAERRRQIPHRDRY